MQHMTRPDSFVGVSPPMYITPVERFFRPGRHKFQSTDKLQEQLGVRQICYFLLDNTTKMSYPYFGNVSR